jgi:hypothetical protein
MAIYILKEHGFSRAVTAAKSKGSVPHPFHVLCEIDEKPQHSMQGETPKSRRPES